MYRHLLVPVDDTEISAANVTAAVEFARDAAARITFFHASPDYAATGDGALMHAMSPATFAERAAGPARAILAKAEAAARAADVVSRSVAWVSDKPAQAILEAAARERCDLLFMASHGPTSIGGITLGSHTLKVITGATIPVLVSSVGSNAPHAARDAALATIRDEHRSIAAVLHALRTLFESSASGAAVDFQLVRAAVHYLRTFPQALHHPKEEEYVFVRLRNRSPEFNHVLDELERQHMDGATLLDAVAAALDACDGHDDSVAALREAWNAFANNQWRHMRAEEETVLPAARELIPDADWREIADAFARNGDPRFDRAADADLRALLAKIMNLAPRRIDS